MMKRIKKAGFIKILLCVLGGVMLIYFGYMFYLAITYIQSGISQGQIVFTKNFGEILQYIMVNTSSYLFYGIVLLVFARVYPSKVGRNTVETKETE